MTFDELGLCEPILRAVAEEGYTTPTPIQEAAIPHVLAGKDILGTAQTGTGKTAAFALPILHHLITNPPQPSPRRRTRALILTPTRELAIQVAESFANYGKYAQFKIAVLYGGVNQNPQITLLIHGVDIIVATPGRLLDLMDQGWADVKRAEKLVLDEADNMLDMGFIADIRKIIARTPQWRQTLLFSATMPQEIRRLANEILTDPVEVSVAPVSSAADTVEQSVYFVNAEDKPAALLEYLQSTQRERTLVFTRTKQGADRVAQYLTRAGVRAGSLHSDKMQSVRLQIVERFKSGELPLVVATDIAARGLDIDNVSHVVNYDVPHVAENYVHRIGRTGRAGATGVAVSFCEPRELRHLRAIQRLIRQEIRVAELPGFTKPVRSEGRPARQNRSTSRKAAEGQNPANRSSSSSTNTAVAGPQPTLGQLGGRSRRRKRTPFAR